MGNYVKIAASFSRSYFNFCNLQADSYRGLRRFQNEPVAETDEAADDQDVDVEPLELVKGKVDEPTTNENLRKLRNFCMRYSLWWYKICQNTNEQNVAPQLVSDFEYETYDLY